MDGRAKRRRLNPKDASDSEDERIDTYHRFLEVVDRSDSRPSAEESEESMDEEEISSDEESNEETTDDSEDEEEEDSLGEDDIIQEELASIDFGTLAKAQRTLIQESSTRNKSTKPPPKPSKFGAQTKTPSTEPKSKSKNAPQEVSSKRPVSRKHFLPSVQNRHHARDPRFETLSTADSSTSFRKAYDFLDSYQRDEITLLKSQIRQSRDQSDREKLEKTLQSLTSRRDARIAKDRANEVLRKKKEEELEKIKHGKQPFYLKKSEKRKLVMEEKYSKLGKRRLEKVLEKKRKKKEGKELKRIPRQRAH